MKMKNLEQMKNVFDISYVESNQPQTTVRVEVGKDFNLSNLKYNKAAMKLANVLSVGGTVVITDNKTSVTVRLEDAELIKHFQLCQLEYLLSKYNKITGPYAKIARQYFSDRKESKEFFASKAWKEAKERIYKTNVLDALVPALMGYEEERLCGYRDYAERKRLDNMWTQAAKAKVFKADVDKDLPNQDVTTAIQRDIDLSIRIGETGPYVDKGRNYVSTPADELEAKIVNAWFYKHPAFRKPSQDELADELETLREWFEQYKYNARRNGVKKPQADTIAKYERLEYLEIEVGTYLNNRISNAALY